MKRALIVGAAWLGLSAPLEAAEPLSSAACHGPAALADFGSDGRIGAKWNATSRSIAFGRTDAHGAFHTFVADADGSHERRLSFAAWHEDRHQFPAAWHPGGEY